MSQPIPAHWERGEHLRINVAVKASAVGGDWGAMEDLEVPEMTSETVRESLFLPVEEEEWEAVGEGDS